MRDTRLASIYLSVHLSIHPSTHPSKDVDYRTPHGKTPLYEAATEGHSRCVHLLLASNAAVDLAHSSGTTPLMSAVYHGHAVVVEVRACLPN